MKIVVFDAEPWEQEAFKSLMKVHDVRILQEPLTNKSADEYAEVEILSLFVHSKASKEVLQKLPKLQFIATRSTGYDHIDLNYCHQQGITVANVPTYGENTVAEHVFALLLTISHHMYEAIGRTRSGDFSSQGLQGFDLQGKTLGVIGTGHIGRHVIQIAHGFQMQVLGYDPEPDANLQHTPAFQYVDLNTLFAQSDIISVHVPANEKTKRMISFEAFGRMKQGVVLINTARGSVVDTRALVEALGEKKVLAAGLDVLPEEPTIREEAELLRTLFHKNHDLEALLADHILLRQHNVFITPHSAFNTQEAMHRILNTTIENIEGYLAGSPKNLVILQG